MVDVYKIVAVRDISRPLLNKAKASTRLLDQEEDANNMANGKDEAHHRCLKLGLVPAYGGSDHDSKDESVTLAFEVEPLPYPIGSLLGANLRIQRAAERRHGMVLLTPANCQIEPSGVEVDDIMGFPELDEGELAQLGVSPVVNKVHIIDE